jgi:glycosyltransferase involved in cell wall biosynthesis
VAGMSEPPLITVIVPVYNEETTVRDLVRSVREAPFRKEILVVDDGSTDGTAREVEAVGADDLRLLRQDRNLGKGAAIRRAIPEARGEVVIIQDADLEYDPTDIPRVVEGILRGTTNVAYGCRFTNGFPRGMAAPNRAINRILAGMVRVLYGAPLKDEATCYKAFRTDLLKTIPLTCKRFEFCPEVTAKVLRAGERIAEVPIGYTPRTKKAGKKIGWWDGIVAIWTLIKYRIVR